MASGECGGIYGSGRTDHSTATEKTVPAAL